MSQQLTPTLPPPPSTPISFDFSSPTAASAARTPEHNPHVQRVKPLQTAFMSTGLISKRNRGQHTKHKHIPPDTPCKKPAYYLTTDVPSCLALTPRFETKKLFGKGEKRRNSFPDKITPNKRLQLIDRSSLTNSRGYLNVPQHHDVLAPYPHFLRPEYFKDYMRIAPKWMSPSFFKKPSLDDSPLSTSTQDYFDYHFKHISIIGRGEFSEVSKVQDRTTGKHYAVKKTKLPFISPNDRFEKLQEVAIIWSLECHDNVIRLVDAWEQFGYLYLQMELCENGSLYSYLEDCGSREPVEERRIWRILADLAKGLKHLHNSNIIHLDIKPANILIHKDGKLKIADFGMAARLPVRSGSEHEGDREYLAPEILHGRYDKPADIFSLGLIILEMAANVILPENGPIWQRLRRGDLSDCKVQNFSSELVRLIRGMLSPDPAARPTAEQILSHPLVVDAENHSLFL
ncbi:uncharacterized protein VTP21DRAFT_9257 [Calcarisporiella thermophila]|uniref:uncharacterized protein n=1 Tax=Calcarisporiella thermophila TaxID=911321 RepID=UPI00374431C6